jgi:hypothetical protein
VRIGLLGPSSGDVGTLREAVEFLIGDAACDQAIYLGVDDTIDRVVGEWAAELIGGAGNEEAFLDRVAEVAPAGSAADLERLLAADTTVRRLESVRKIPAPPARAVEMLDDRIVLVVHDKAVLDEDDIASAHLIVYGRSQRSDLKRFGPRYFFTPGPLAGGKVGMVELLDDGQVELSLYDPSGAPLWREALERRTGRVVVQ